MHFPCKYIWKSGHSKHRNRSDASTPPRPLPLPTPITVFQRLTVDAVFRSKSRAASASLPASPPPESQKIPLEDAVRIAERLSYEAVLRTKRLESAMQARDEAKAAEAYRLANTPHINRKSLSLLTARKAENMPSQPVSAAHRPQHFTPAQALASGQRLMQRKRVEPSKAISRKSSQDEKERAEKAVARLYPKRTLSVAKLEELQRTYTLKRGWELGKGSEPTTKDSNETPGKEIDSPDLSAISQHCEESPLAKLLVCSHPKKTDFSLMRKPAESVQETSARPRAPFPLAVSVPRELLDFVQRFPND